MGKTTEAMIAFLVCMSFTCVVYARSANEAWNDLADSKGSGKAPFAFVQNNPALPNVLLYGDSISIGYTERVQQALKGKANVYRIYCNGGDSRSFIPKMTKMHSTMRDEKLDGHWAFDWDVIHFNVGLHDLKYVAENRLDTKNGKQVASTETYEKNLRSIVTYLLKLAPKARLVFATSTPVPEGAQGRIAGDAAEYNAVAVKVMKAFPQVTINDLFSFTKPHHSQWAFSPRDVHYNANGRNAQGDEVARVILNILEEKKQAE